MERLKNSLRYVLMRLHIDLTMNIRYDRLTKQIMKKIIKNDSNCIDVGCHKGEILNIILKYAPQGTHYGFEPIPLLFSRLKEKYSGTATIYPYALSDKDGQSSFQYVKNAPAYSGIKRRKYDDVKNPDIEEIIVELKMLDHIIPADIKIDFIKIDVEGGEFAVLKGAKELLKKHSPTLIFECGMGASDCYGTNPLDIYNYLTEDLDFNIYTLGSFTKNKAFLTAEEFQHYFQTGEEYYFVAVPFAK